MTRPTALWLAWTLAGIAVAGMAGSLVVWAVAGGDDPFALDAIVFSAAFLAIPVVGAAIATREPRNAIGWVLLAMGLAAGLGTLADSWVASDRVPGRSWAALIGQVGLGGLTALPFVLLLFPDGSVPSPRWRWALWLSGAAAATLLIASLLSPELVDYPGVRNPIGVDAIRDTPIEGGGVGWLLIAGSILVSAASLVVRYRRGQGEERLQLRWLALSAVMIGVGWLFLVIGFDAQPDDLVSRMLRVPFALGLLSLPIAIGVAILKYRLYDIDVVISKTVVVGSLALFIGVVYVAVVVGLGTLLGDPENPALSIAATAVVAVLFEPARERARSWANRLVYGERATPYEVMSDFAARAAGTPSLDRVLPEMAEAAGRGVGASRVEIRVLLSGGREHVERWPADGQTDDGSVPGDPVTLPIAHRGEPVGELSITKPADEPVTRGEERLLGDLASQAGLALHNVRLNDELELRLDELDRQAAAIAASRERLVTARDVQRRNLESDIREGPRRQLGEIRRRLGALTHCEIDDAAAAISELDQLEQRASETLEGLRDLARGVFPPLLAERGIVPALQAHVRKVGANATVDATPGLAALRFHADVEACVYFCCLQAIQNVVRHAGNAACIVRLAHDDGSLVFSIEDHGPGFDPATTPRGMGLRIVQDRVDALEGELRLDSAAGRGTRIDVRVPAGALEGAPA